MLSLVFVLATVIWVLIFVDEPLPFFARNAQMSGFFIESLLTTSYNLVGIVVALVLARLYHGWRQVSWSQILSTALLAFTGIALFMVAFGSFKATLGMVWPFYADDIFAEMDRWMLFGQEAWVIAHQLIPELGAKWIDLIYGRMWISLVFLFPFFLFLFDKDKVRIARYILLYFAAFFLVGNILALVFLSVGPVYYDTYYGANLYANLPAALDKSGVSASFIGNVQSILGEALFANDSKLGSDVAAFPSVHVSTIMVVALYAVERSRVLGFAMAILVAAILFLSVYTGYHWLVDGLASILIMIAVNAWLKRSQIVTRLAK